MVSEARCADDNSTLPEHPCYVVAEESCALGRKRRAEECPVCSAEGGVGGLLSDSVPCFSSPVSVLVCRGSGAVMTHENPPMALPNGQVENFDFRKQQAECCLWLRYLAESSC